MKHKISGRKLNRTSEHRKALFMNMSNSLIEHERITTTLPKAKALRPVIEKLITSARKGNLHARRLLVSKLQNQETVEKLMTSLTERFKNRAGGYTRIIKAGFRYGDAAPMGVIELLDQPKVLVKNTFAKE